MSTAASHRALALLTALLVVAATPRAHAYALIGGAWPTGAITMQLQLDATAPTNTLLPLTDGSTSWNAVAQSAIALWNGSGVLVRSQLANTMSTSASAKLGDGLNNVFFSATVYDQSFGANTLAVTLVDHYDNDGLPTVRSTEGDLIVNNARSWNSYRGAIRSSPLDLRRVLVHELGHVLGLDHPDQAVPAQSVFAIMNSAISNLETIQTDDRDGAAYLYATAVPVPTLTTAPTNQTASVSNPAGFAIGVNGAMPPPAPQPSLLSYKWYFRASGATKYEKLFTVDSPDLHFGTVQLTDAGSYYVQIMTPDTTVTSNPVTLTVNPVTIAPTTSLANLSNRAVAGAGKTMIVGFVVTGTRPKSVLLRAVGPSLGSFGVAGTLSDPMLTLKKLDGTTLEKTGRTWDGGANAADLKATMARLGAFPLTAGTRDAVILRSLDPGSYTAETTNADNLGNTGVVLVEAYDADPVLDASSRLANLSTRGYVGTGQDVLIAGFVVQGPGPRTYLLRVAGPTLTTFGVTNTLYDPMLSLFGASSVLLRSTDDWDSPAATKPTLQAAFDRVGAFGFTDRKESAMLVTLPPGSYSAQASGNDNDGSTSPVGNAIIEIYELPAP